MTTHLARITSGPVSMPVRMLLWGVEGCGKSTFAAGAPAPIWIGQELGTGHLDVVRLPQPAKWDELLAYTRELQAEKHPYKTLVIDPLGWVEQLVWDAVCERNKWPNIEHPGYGKGYVAALQEWRRLIYECERLYLGGMNILFIGHSRTKAQRSPDTEDFDRYVVAMNDQASGLFKQWCDYVLFARYAVWTEKDDKKQTKGHSSGKRVMHTQWNAAFDAKSRPNLPPVLPLAWDAFVQARAASSPVEKEALRQRVLELIATCTDKNMAAKAERFLAEEPDDVLGFIDIERKLVSYAS